MKRNTTWLIAAVLLSALPAHAANPPAVQWERVFQGYDTCMGYVLETRDRGFLIPGVLHVHPAGNNTFIMKIDSLGNTIWQKVFDIAPAGTSEGVSFCEKTKDGGFVFCGGEDTGRAMVLKTDSLGNIQWKFAAFPWSPLCAIEQTKDGGYIAGGMGGGYEIYLLKLDSAGHLLWRKGYGWFRYDWSMDNVPVHQTSDGGYIVAGETLLIKTDSLGNVLWRRAYPDVRLITSVQKTPDGGFVATGMARAPWPIGNIKPFNMFLLKTDSAGVLQWKRVFTEGSESVGEYVGLTSDGGFVVGGDITIGRLSFARVVRTDSQGNRIWTKTLDERTGVSSVHQTSDGGYILNWIRKIWKLAPEQ